MAFKFVAWLRGLLLLLLVEFFLGIWLMLYGTFPSTSNVVRVIMYRGDPALTAHMAIAVLLVVLAFVFTVASFGADAPPRLRWYSLAGFIALLGAYESGAQFIESGFSNNLFSLAMLIAFFVAAGCFGFSQRVLALASRPPPVAPTPPTVGSA